MYYFHTNQHQILSDIHSPVELYLKLRDKFSLSFLLESSDYKSKENSFSYLCLESIASFVVERQTISITYPNQNQEKLETSQTDIKTALQHFIQTFKSEDLGYKFYTNGLFGYTSYDAIPLFEAIQFRHQSFDLPLLQYHLFRYVLVFNHFNNELFIFEHLLAEETSRIQEILAMIKHRAVSSFSFDTTEEEIGNYSERDFLEKIDIAKKHCQRGDVFQVVLSRKFSQKFKGDEFNVYRALRSINPSPYLFYFDYGNFKIFGSSPEAQLQIKEQKAYINPIAGTFRRTGDTQKDAELALLLSEDAKETAEHIMLVDLARNDLSKKGKNIRVERFKQVEYYSHVIHLVSQVSADLEDNYSPIEILANTYPAGTLSGAPKHRAMQIIDEQENTHRGFYGGTVGILGLDGSINQAIFIRSFLSQQYTLSYQAGCGIVVKSDTQSELNEINNKLSALRKAILLAKNI
ncbi:MAG: anthranilate synthase component I family protein [Thermonemataceae bacterium]|nr:anthranilate synthase component I family protein [Thermonemataceae bacterium]